MPPSNSITILTIGILTLACSRLGSLFWQPALVPASIDVPTTWRSFSANSRAKFMLGVLLLGFAYAASQILDSGKGLQAFALVLILLPSGIGGICCVLGATWQHRYHAMPPSEATSRSRAMEFDTLALVALLMMALFYSRPALAAPDAQPSDLAARLYQTILYLSVGFAVSIGVRNEPPFFRVQVEPQISWRGGVFMLAWFPWSVFKEHWLEALSPLLALKDGDMQTLPMAEARIYQDQFVTLCLGSLLLLLALPFLQQQIPIVRKKPFLFSLLLSIVPVILLTAASFERTEGSIPTYAVLAAVVSGALVGQLLWHYCQVFTAWLRLHQTSWEIPAYLFHCLSIVGLLAVSWIGIFQAEGIDRYFILVAQCAALSSWGIRRFS